MSKKRKFDEFFEEETDSDSENDIETVYIQEQQYPKQALVQKVIRQVHEYDDDVDDFHYPIIRSWRLALFQKPGKLAGLRYKLNFCLRNWILELESYDYQVETTTATIPPEVSYTTGYRMPQYNRYNIVIWWQIRLRRPGDPTFTTANANKYFKISNQNADLCDNSKSVLSYGNLMLPWTDWTPTGLAKDKGEVRTTRRFLPNDELYLLVTMTSDNQEDKWPRVLFSSCYNWFEYY